MIERLKLCWQIIKMHQDGLPQMQKHIDDENEHYISEDNFVMPELLQSEPIQFDEERSTPYDISLT